MTRSCRIFIYVDYEIRIWEKLMKEEHPPTTFSIYYNNHTSI